MRFKPLTVWAVLACVPLAGCVSPARGVPDTRAIAAAGDAAPAPPEVHPVDCGFSTGNLDVRCGYIEVLENRARPQGRKIPFHFVRVASTGENPAPDPLVFLAGGPGQGGTPGAVGQAFRNMARLGQRDLLLVDQRGTGRSNPLDCISHDLKADPAGFRRLFDEPFFDPQRFRACLDELSTRADVTQYTTTAAVEDLEELRRALGYERLNLEGGSYGTRYALEFIRRYPGSVRSAVLRGVAPSFALLVETVARDCQDALDALIAACEADAACAQAYPDFRDELTHVLERVRREPVEVAMTNPGNGKKEEITLGYDQLVTALRYNLYSTRQSSSLPRRVRAAAAGDYAPLAGSLTQLLPTLHNAVAEGMWASVKCSEEVAFIDVERARELSRGTVLGTLRLDAETAICSFWPRGEIPDDFHEPVVSDVPVLLVAGQYDPASPLALAERAAKHLERGTLVAVANRSHWGLGGDDCVEGIVDGFLAAGSGEGLDLSCLSGYERPAFAVSD
jgi:pimeloyl-ACP methyl ester carboxylesterase